MFSNKLKSSTTAALMVALAASIAVSGCGRKRTVIEKQEIVVHERDREPVREVIVREGQTVREVVTVRPEPPPPPAPASMPEPAPSSEFIWIDGAYEWVDGRWAWTPGRWERPTHAGAVWVPGRWVSVSNGYIWERGHWR